MNSHILIVEDEENLARFVELELLHEGYQVSKAFNGRTAYELAVKENFDLILLDVMLPGLNGLEVLRRINQEKPTPVILLTARDAVMDKVAGLDAGAVDYITKPFAIEELLARIRVALKIHTLTQASYTQSLQNNAINTNSSTGIQYGRNGFSAISVPYTDRKREGIYTWNDLTLDEPRHRVDYSGHEITLTNREFEMLKTLLQNKDIVLSRDTLLERVCGYDYVGETNVVDVYIRYLRSKIDEAFHIKMIQTVRGVGYVIKSDQ